VKELAIETGRQTDGRMQDLMLPMGREHNNDESNEYD